MHKHGWAQKCIHFEYTPSSVPQNHIFLSCFLSSSHRVHLLGQGDIPMKCTKTFFDLVTLTYALDLNILPHSLHAKFQVHMSIQVGERDIQTHRSCQISYIHHVADAGFNNFISSCQERVYNGLTLT